MTLYNLDKLVKVRVNDFYPAIWFKYKPLKTLFGFVMQREGFYSTITDRLRQTDLPEGHALRDGVLFEKPEVVLHFESGHIKKHYFDSLDAANDFADQITRLGNWHK